MRVISILGKKERIKEISLKTNKLEGNKEAYLENVLKKMSKNLMEMKKTIANFIERQESF